MPIMGSKITDCCMMCEELLRGEEELICNDCLGAGPKNAAQRIRSNIKQYENTSVDIVKKQKERIKQAEEHIKRAYEQAEKDHQEHIKQLEPYLREKEKIAQRVENMTEKDWGKAIRL